MKAFLREVSFDTFYNQVYSGNEHIGYRVWYDGLSQHFNSIVNLANKIEIGFYYYKGKQLFVIEMDHKLSYYVPEFMLDFNYYENVNIF